MSTRPPEQELLICVACRHLDDRRRLQLRQLLSADLDWENLAALARINGLIPLLYKHLASVSDSRTNAHLAKLREESRANAQETLYLISKLLKIVKRFRAEGIRLVTFKGPLLSQMAYGELVLRQSGDIDLLVERHQFHQAKQLLNELGYQMTPSLTPFQEASHLKFHCEIQFVRDEWFTVADLHWGLTPKSFVFRLATDEVIARSQVLHFAGEILETFGTHDLVLYQCMHGSKHLWSRLEWVSSLAELLRTFELTDWDILIDRATKARATRMVALGLQLVKRLSDVSVPDQIILRIDRNEAMSKLAAQIEAQFFNLERRRTVSTETGLFNFRIMDRKRDALLSLARAMFVPTLSDWEDLRLPDAVQPLHYVIRPLRLSKNYCTLLWRKLSGQSENVMRA